jgi:hypothetical protein
MMKDDREGMAMSNNLLKEKLLRRLPGPGLFPTAIEGLTISRRHDSRELENCIYRPLVAVVVQGSKRSVIGSEEYRYGENHCLVVVVDVPSANHVITASPERSSSSVSARVGSCGSSRPSAIASVACP